MRSVHVYSTSPNDLNSLTPNQIEFKTHNNEKGIQKVLRTNKLSEVVLHIKTNEDLIVSAKVVTFIRDILTDRDIWIQILVDADFKIEDLAQLPAIGVGSVKTIKQNTDDIKIELTSLIDHLDRVAYRISDKDNQINLLTSINKFSQYRKRLRDMIEHCAQSLSQFSFAHSTLIAYPSVVTAIKINDKAITNNMLQKLEEYERELLRSFAMNTQAPKVELLPQSIEKLPIIRSLKCEIGGILIYPIVIYGKTIASIFCLLEEDNLDKFETSKINIMRETASHLELILERRQAEKQLVSQYQRLKETLHKLETTKEQLIHSEKMASVGTMAAGIAHEINNPLAFVIGNFDPLEEYVDSLVHMLNLHDQLVSSIDQSSVPDLTKKISETKDEQDIDFIKDDLLSIVSDSREGLLRVRDIISDLSSFTRKDKIETKEFNLNQLVDETLRILKYELSDKINIVSSIPKEMVLTSHRGFIQQIITNLIKNAGHALSDHSDNGNKKICVSAIKKEDVVLIKVIDNGPGIPKEAKNQIFDPFFTTKDVGKGTGLGLSVSYNLAEKIGAKLKLNTENEIDTEFQLVVKKG